MHILLTNDDGIFAPGLAAIYKYLVQLGNVTVVAPSDVQSGAGHSISLRDISCEHVSIDGKFDGYSVNGSPADCVKLAVNELIAADDTIDLVISGMNHGANVGINVFYSGTVAGAIEGAFYKLPAIAVSAAFDEPMQFDAAAGYALGVIKQLTDIPPGKVASINIPQLSKGKPKGVIVTPQSTSGFIENYDVRTNDTGEKVYKLSGGSHRDPDTTEWMDTTALKAGYITVSALKHDLTDNSGNKLLKQKNVTL